MLKWLAFLVVLAVALATTVYVDHWLDDASWSEVAVRVLAWAVVLLLIFGAGLRLWGDG